MSATQVLIGGTRRGLTPALKRLLRRRNAIEPEIGHMKTDGRLSRCPLKGTTGDAIFAVLCGCGHNLRKILAHLRALLTLFITTFAVIMNALIPEISRRSRQGGIQKFVQPEPSKLPSWMIRSDLKEYPQARLEEAGLDQESHGRPHSAIWYYLSKLCSLPLTEQAKGSNRTKSPVCARVEHVFGAQANAMGGTLVRMIGMVRAKAKIGRKNLACNEEDQQLIRRINSPTNVPSRSVPPEPVPGVTSADGNQAAGPERKHFKGGTPRTLGRATAEPADIARVKRLSAPHVGRNGQKSRCSKDMPASHRLSSTGFHRRAEHPTFRSA